MKKTLAKTETRMRRKGRIRARVSGTATKPRLVVFKSNVAVYAQLIDDEAGKTLAAADTRKATSGTLTEKATTVGTTIGEAAKKAGLETVVFDRGGFKYQGVIAAVADGARATGLAF